jgi:Asp-tRNA(Asn)/Glu-tRNA(Gln) amidotransferase A subunit family amidase
MGGILEKTVWELSELLAKREISSEELTLCCLSQIEKQEPEIGAYITVTADRALRSAAETDKKRKTGEPLSILAGIPAAINDNICTKGVLTSCASKMLYNFVPPYDAHVAELLRGCPLLGKLNMDEFAMGFSTENSAVKTTKNPAYRAAAPQPRLRHARRRLRSARTPAAQSACRRRSAALSVSGRHTGAYRATGLPRLRPRSTKLPRWQKTCATAQLY